MTSISAASPSRPGGRGNTSTLALTALAPAVWGTTYIVTTELLPAGHPLFTSCVRALPAGLLALAISRSLPRGAWWWRSLVLGTLSIGLFFPFLFLTAQHLPGGVAATLGATQPIMVAFLVVGLLRERLSLWRVVWAVAGLGGVAMVVLGPGAGLDLLGVATGLAGAASMAVGVVLTKRWGRPTGVSAIALAGWQLTAGGLVLLLPALLIDGVPTLVGPTGLVGYAWLGVMGGLVAYALWFDGIRRLPVTGTALLGLLSPLVAAILGVVVLDQRLSPIQLIGFVVALTAMVAGQVRPPRALTLAIQSGDGDRSPAAVRRSGSPR